MCFLRRLLLSYGLLLVGCSAPGSQETRLPPQGEEERRAFLSLVANDIILPRLEQFADKSNMLAIKTGEHASAAGQNPDLQLSARQAWREAMDVWQQLEVLHVGPAGASGTFTGGTSLRDGIYAWPQKNLCGIDQEVVRNEFLKPGYAAGKLVNVLGLTALEYLLFFDGPGNSCPGSASINRDGQWDSLSSAELANRRANMARVLAEDVRQKSEVLRNTWRDDFRHQFTTAGLPGSAFPTAQQAIDELYAALFSLEFKTKDLKVGLPAGLRVECTTQSCPDKTESPFSKSSKENILSNLAAVRRIFLGQTNGDENGPGFDDLLAARGQASLASDMLRKLDSATQMVSQIPTTWEDHLVSDITGARAIYDAIKAFTDDLKSSFASTLGLRVPDEGAGDND